MKWQVSSPRWTGLATKWTNRRRQIAIFFAVIGPGIITANVDNDAGGIYTYSLAGAQFGYKLLWTMIPMTLALIVVQEMAARMGAVTGKGLSDLIREEFGFRATFLMMLAMLAANLGNILAEFAGIASSLEIFGISKYVSVPLSAILVWVLVVKGTYKSIEKVFLIACMVYFSYIISGFLAHPDWLSAVKATVVPQIEWNRSYLVMTIGVIGTTIAPWMQFYLQSAVVEKTIPLRRYRALKLDVVLGCIITDLVAFFIVVCCAATLFAAGHRHIADAAEAAEALKPLAGNYASILFAFGLFNASIFAASILPLSTAFFICEGLGFEAGVDKRFDDAPVFYWLYTALIVVGAGLILVPRAPLIRILVLSQVANGIVLPYLLIFMLILVNRKDLMGAYTNSRWFNVVAWFTSIILMAMTAALIYFTIRGGAS